MTTIYSTIQKLHPVRNEMKLSVYTTEQFDPNVSEFKNIIALFVDGDFVYSYDVIPDANGLATVDISNVCQSYQTTDTLDSLSITNQDYNYGEQVHQWQVEVSYQYKQISSGQIFTSTVQTTSDYENFFFNAELPIPEYINYDYKNYTFAKSVTPKFLTSFTGDIPIEKSEDFYISMLMDDVFPTNLQCVVTYSNGQTQTLNVPISISSYPAFYGKHLYTFNVGPNYLSTKAINFTNVKSYTVQLISSPNYSEVKKFTMYNYNKCEKKRVYWANHLGGIDALTFASKQIENFTFNRSYYKQNLNLDYNSGELQLKSNTELNITTDKSYDISTDKYKKEYYSALLSLFKSYHVYLYNPVNINVDAIIPNNVVFDYYETYYHEPTDAVYGIKDTSVNYSPLLGKYMNNYYGPMPNFFWGGNNLNPGLQFNDQFNNAPSYDLEGDYNGAITNVAPNNYLVTGVGVGDPDEALFGVYDISLLSSVPNFVYHIPEFTSPYNTGYADVLGTYGSTYIVVKLYDDFTTVYPGYDPMYPGVSGSYDVPQLYPSPYQFISLGLGTYSDPIGILNPYSGDPLHTSYSVFNSPVTLTITEKTYNVADTVKLYINDNNNLHSQHRVVYAELLSKSGNNYTIDLPNVSKTNSPLINIATIQDDKGSLIPLNVVTNSLSNNINDKNYITFNAQLKETYD